MDINELIQQLNQQPRNVTLWLHLASKLDDEDKKTRCYQKVLQIMPGNTTAIKRLRELGVDLKKDVLTDAEKESATPESTVLSKLESSRDELLDLSLNNKLINYRTLKTKGLVIVDEKTKEIFRILVKEDRTMSFLTKPEDEKEKEKEKEQLVLDEDLIEDYELGQPDEEEDPDLPAERHTDNRLQTPYSSKELQKRLLNTYYAARTIMQEQGVNTLFLALGMLNWYESQNSEIMRKAPLILIPVELSRTSVQARFRINYSQDEIGENLSLRAKLKNDFGFTLPALPEDEGITVHDYYDQVSKRICHIDGWEVDRNSIVLGFFSYAKFLMFNDLDPDNWPEEKKPQDHPIIRSLLHDGFTEDTIDLGEDELVDDLIDLSEANHVVDADSSQSLAILDASKGKNLVIQGPPGTGKSQTISNLIADAIQKEKKVLFVAEKMAALEVVKRRLDHIGLGKACLEIHSRKTKKKVFLDELKHCLELGQPKEEFFIDRNMLGQYQEKLNQYAKAVNTEIGESNLTPHELYGKLLKLDKVLDGVSVPNYSIPDITKWGRIKYERIKNLVAETQQHLSEIGKPLEHPFYGSNVDLYLPYHKEEFSQLLQTTLKKLNDLIDKANRLGDVVHFRHPKNTSQTIELLNISDYILSAPKIEHINVDTTDWYEKEESIRRTLENCERISEIHSIFDSKIEKEAWGKDIHNLQKSLNELRSKWWWFISLKYRRLRQEFNELVKEEVPNTLPAMNRILDIITEEDDLQKKVDQEEELMKSLFDGEWKRESSDWDYLNDVTSYFSKMHKDIKQDVISSSVRVYFSSHTNDDDLKKILIETKKSFNNYASQLKKALKKLELSWRLGHDSETPLIAEDFEYQKEQLSLWMGNLDRIQEIITLRGLLEPLKEEKLSFVIRAVIKWDKADVHLVDSLDKYYYQELLNKAMKERPSLAQFDGNLHERDMDRFCDLDTQLLELNRIHLAKKHWEALPQHQAAGQLGILTHEFAKKRRHKPIRRLMKEAGNVIQTIKPVFMMSPLSVAMFLPPGTIEFDMVVFDEASQVEPVDAFGAILRGDQVVIAGDDKQLPPTTFFEKSIDVEEDETDSITIDLESVLGLSRSQGIPQRMLRWHYRSEHESLIAVSNNEFYDNKLVIFPSPDKEKQALGLVYHHLPDSTYDRGKSRTNVGEAKEIAKAVFSHAENSPELTLGVAAFSSSQANAIRDQLEILRRQNPGYEEFFKSHEEERFFVKNLENVQGDERDVIYISVGYGWAPDGSLRMNFGPLNRSGGERRLNVLITRARKRCEIFTNLLPVDIDLTRTTATGVRVLKKYLSYAKDGDMETPISTGEGPESPFEAEVANELKKKGYRVDYQIGAAGFFIDLAIIDEDHPGQYLIGIECDGASYHSARSARDRDRLRQYVLEDLGWTIHRVWSTDWFRNPQKELGKLIDSVEKAKATANHKKKINSKPSPASSFAIKREKNTKEEERQVIKVLPYKTHSFNIELYGSSLHKVSNQKMAQWIKDIVTVEGPIHVDEVARRILDAAKVKRFGRRIKEKYKRGIKVAVNNGHIRRKGDFLCKPGKVSLEIRSREKAPETSRDLRLIAPEEIQEAIIEVIKASYGISEDELPSEVCGLFGFARVSGQMQSIIDKNIEELKRKQKVVKEEGFLVIPSEDRGS